MSLPSAQPSPNFVRIRAFLSDQGLFLVVALALFAILRLTNWSGADFGAILLYSLVAGNLVSPAMNRLAPLSSRFRRPYDWVAYESCLALVAFASSAAAVAITMAAYRIPLSRFPSQFRGGGRPRGGVRLIVGTE